MLAHTRTGNTHLHRHLAGLALAVAATYPAATSGPAALAAPGGAPGVASAPGPVSPGFCCCSTSATKKRADGLFDPMARLDAQLTALYLSFS